MKVNSGQINCLIFNQIVVKYQPPISGFDSTRIVSSKNKDLANADRLGIPGINPLGI